MITFLLAAAVGHVGFNLVHPIDIVEAAPVYFGEVLNDDNASCQLSREGRTGSGCIGTDAQLGLLTLSAKDHSNVNVIVHSIENNHFKFEPLLADGEQSQQFTVFSGNLNIDIGGKITVITKPNNGDYKLEYIIEVNYD
ncbi:hypothetical protein [Shewanella waksmanii]|uniref:hypothetical protein n=1 Tax=Shewanella waksmanii TaxID=213783 RepID=UPI0037362DF7